MQPDNLQRVISMGFGTGFPLPQLTNDSLYNAIRKVWKGEVRGGGGGRRRRCQWCPVQVSCCETGSMLT